MHAFLDFILDQIVPDCFESRALRASSRSDAICFLPSTVCSSQVTTRNSDFQQLAKDGILNPNQWEVHLIDFKFCEDTRPGGDLLSPTPRSKSTAQRAYVQPK
jgi:hypothetical protein